MRTPDPSTISARALGGARPSSPADASFFLFYFFFPLHFPFLAFLRGLNVFLHLNANGVTLRPTDPLDWVDTTQEIAKAGGAPKGTFSYSF